MTPAPALSPGGVRKAGGLNALPGCIVGLPGFSQRGNLNDLGHVLRPSSSQNLLPYAHVSFPDNVVSNHKSNLSLFYGSWKKKKEKGERNKMQRRKLYIESHQSEITSSYFGI